MRQTLRREAALNRPILRVLFATVVVLSLFPLAIRADEDASSRRDAAKSQFERAEKAREALEARPESVRTLKDYTALVIEYQRVYLITSHAADVPAALNEVAELFRAMGDLFDAKYYQRSIDSFQFLLQEYPTSKYREDALLAIGQIQMEDLHDPALARKTYQQFLTLHPRSSHAAEVRAILDKASGEMAEAKPPEASAGGADRRDRAATKSISADKIPPTTDTEQGASKDNSDTDEDSPHVSRIRTWNADKYTRVVIDVGAKVKYQAARLSRPDRIYFDVEGAKLSSALLHKTIDLDGNGFLKNVRVAQNQAGVVRVVLEINRASDYSVFLLPDPYRLVVDVYGNSTAAETAARSTEPPPGPTTEDKPGQETAAKPLARGTEKAPTDSPNAMDDTEPKSRKQPSQPGKNSEKPGATTPSKASRSQISDTSGSTLSAAASPADAEILTSPAHPRLPKKSARDKKSAHDQAAEMGPPSIPDLTLDGQHSLTRALGLKIGRIVIDAGHGGHDTGTIGPTGLMEKDLCLDVALRLGKIIQQRLPNAEVVFTRNDDTFVPLERRTEIANEAKADLFISIHANSSQDHQARGVETYYLNFTGSSDAMEVASRENALSENAVHDLQDIVKKIASNEKIEESRDLATMIQDSLAKRMENMNRGDRNRGVRKAPFVVLIGANMPSVLAEISFLSNPSDEQWLKKPENRQRVADGLYRGIEIYLQSTNSLTSIQLRSAAENENIVGKVARSGNSQ